MQPQPKPNPEESFQPERRKIIIKKKSLKASEQGVQSSSLSFRLIDFSIYDENVEAQAEGEEQHHAPLIINLDKTKKW